MDEDCSQSGDRDTRLCWASRGCHNGDDSVKQHVSTGLTAVSFCYLFRCSLQ